jgi:hypothetical protein
MHRRPLSIRRQLNDRRPSAFVRGCRFPGRTLRSRRRRRHEKPTPYPTPRSDAWVAWVVNTPLEWACPADVGIVAARNARSRA